MSEVAHRIGARRIRVRTLDGPIKVEAEVYDDVWRTYWKAHASTVYDALSKVAASANMNREHLLIIFGIEP